MIKPKYTIEITQSLQNNWVVTLYEVSEKGKFISRMATCPLRKQAEQQYRLWKEQFVDKKEKER